MAKKKKTIEITKEYLISAYMDEVLENGSVPKSIYRFCKTHQLEETDFYKFFGSFEGLRKAIWIGFYDHTRQLMVKNKDYGAFSNKERMLTFFYTFFELLTLNRSYVLFALRESGNPLKNLAQLKDLRSRIKDFATDLIQEGNAEKKFKITRHNPKLFSEGAWLQFLFVLKFWMDDDSAGFEKTDMAIEKSINTIFDVFDNMPLDNIVDFGKFLYKETFA